MITGIDVVFIHSSNKELAEWYKKTLGLEMGYADDHWQEFAFKKGSRFALDIPSEIKSVVEEQPIMISFAVDDIKETVENLSSQGVRLFPSKDKTIFDVGHAFVATFQDADGNWMQLSQEKT